VRDGQEHFAAHIAGVNESYDPAWYSALAELEERNFWFVARNRLIGWVAQRYLPQDADYLELGCGTGFVLKMMRRTFPGWRITATEAHAEGLKFAAARAGSSVSFQQMDAQAIPYRDAFDVIGAFDVIEHIKDDEAVLREIHAALRPGGSFVASVPQHMFLWSKYDEVGCHFRRYSMRELAEKLDRAGFAVVESTSFNSVLLPLMLASRLLKRQQREVDVLDELRLGSATNAALSLALRVEFGLTRLGVRWPVGGSRVVLARRRD
jgi:SAM-dependent methyltransferase